MQRILKFIKNNAFLSLFLFLSIGLFLLVIFSNLLTGGRGGGGTTELEENFNEFIRNYENTNSERFELPSDYNSLEDDLPIETALFDMYFENEKIIVRLRTVDEVEIAMQQVYNILKGYSIPPDDPAIVIEELQDTSTPEFDIREV